MQQRLYRSQNKMLAGVAGGLGEYFGIDPTVVRLGWVILFFMNGVGFFAYVVAALIIPNRPKNHALPQASISELREEIERLQSEGADPETVKRLQETLERMEQEVPRPRVSQKSSQGWIVGLGLIFLALMIFGGGLGRVIALPFILPFAIFGGLMGLLPVLLIPVGIILVILALVRK